MHKMYDPETQHNFICTKEDQLGILMFTFDFNKKVPIFI